jgi:alpha-tubulin suppressor-like RCC1 family protein
MSSSHLQNIKFFLSIFIIFFIIASNVNVATANFITPQITNISPIEGPTVGGTTVTFTGTNFLFFIPAVDVTTGANHTCVLLNSKKVKCWGLANVGQLGYGNNNNIGDNELPSTVGLVNVGGDVTQVAAGNNHTCALLTDGNVRCWGQGFFGQLGYGSTSAVSIPANAGNVNVGGTVTQIATGGTHTCALLTTGNVRCWGSASSGQLGYGNTTAIGDNETPSTAGDVNVGGTVTQITAGTNHTCALLNTGNVRCWGLASSGQLGYGNTTVIGDTETPSSAGDINLGSTVTKIVAGGTHTCAIITGGNVKCWGAANNGQLGYGNTTAIGDNETPSTIGNVNIGSTVTELTTGSLHTCVLLSTNGAKCWGSGLNGRLGYGNTSNIGSANTPSAVGNISISGIPIYISAGGSHTCIITGIVSSYNIYCWGLATSGQLGLGNTNSIGDNEFPSNASRVRIAPNTEVLAPTVTLAGLTPAPLQGTGTPSSTTYTITTPPYTPGPVDLVLTNPDGSSVTAVGGYTYLGDCTGSGTVTNVDKACITLDVSSGPLSIITPEFINLNSLQVSQNETTSSGTIPEIVFSDARGTQAGWSSSCKLTNFSGQTRTTDIISLASAVSGGVSKFRLSGQALALYNDGSGLLTGSTDFLNIQNTTTLTDLTSTGESNNFSISSFASGNGQGSYKKDIDIALDVPAFTFAQPYSSTMTCSIG